ncbi:MAG: cyclic nucleotide-binding/CBS domain-containing protein [Halobaculum sp.]
MADDTSVGPDDTSAAPDDTSAVRDVMTEPVLTLEADATVAEAAEGMHEAGINSLVVIDADCYPEGIFTSTDVTRVASEGRDPASVTVSEYMTAGVETVPPEMSLREAAQQLAASGVKHLPVVDGTDAVGMLSTTDLVAVFAGEEPPTPTE